MTTDTLLVTGGAGFIGSHIVDEILGREDVRVTVLDRLSRGGSRFNLADHEGDPRLELVVTDVQDGAAVDRSVSGADAVIHVAAESHVDRSIDGPAEFVLSNVVGTQNVLEACRKHGVRMLMISTDEVYGPGDRRGGSFDEDAPLRPRSPYAASKAAADLMCQAYVTTYDMPIHLVRGTNAYGPRQIEKVIPTYAINALEGSLVPVYGNGAERREFLHVTDWARAALRVFDAGEPGVIYNIGGGEEIANLELAERICDIVGAPRSLIGFVEDRPGHDFRYGVSSERLRSLGWSPKVGFDEGLASTIEWYRANSSELRAAHGDHIVTPPRDREERAGRRG